ncbi:MAG TPA: HAD family hydrolase [Blastocatellia bacterium]
MTSKHVPRRCFTNARRRAIQRAISIILLATALGFGGLCQAVPHRAQTDQDDPLPSWNDREARRAIIDFVTRVTTEGSPDFTPVAERVATFDNDGTLWTERPLPAEVYFIFERVRELVARYPSLRERRAFKAALEGDADYFHREGKKAVLELLVATETGMDQERFAADARRFLGKWRHPKLDRPFTEIAYQPMIELLAYLRRNGFQIWISSGGMVDFLRVFAPQIYGIPINQIIGTEVRLESRMIGDRLVIWRLPEIETVNNKDNKPVGIDRHIGVRPLFVAANVGNGGDIAMMRYSKGRRGPSFQLLINHDDAAREFAYGEKDNASLNAAKKYGFTVASVKDDWKTVFVEPQAAAAR